MDDAGADLVAAGPPPERLGATSRTSPSSNHWQPERHLPKSGVGWEEGSDSTRASPLWLCPLARAQTRHPVALRSCVHRFQLSVQRTGDGKAWQSKSERPREAGEACTGVPMGLGSSLPRRGWGSSGGTWQRLGSAPHPLNAEQIPPSLLSGAPVGLLCVFLSLPRAQR